MFAELVLLTLIMPASGAAVLKMKEAISLKNGHCLKKKLGTRTVNDIEKWAGRKGKG